MTKEQEAIEYLKESVVIYKNTIPKISESIETVLSMLKEKDEKIAKYEKIYKEYDCYRWVKELEKKDKMIDLMAEQLAGLTIWNNEKEKPLILPDIEDVKQYFERKYKECLK